MLFFKTIIWEVQGLEALQKQWAGRYNAQKSYENNGLGCRRLINIIDTMVWKVEGSILINTMAWKVEGPETLYIH